MTHRFFTEEPSGLPDKRIRVPTANNLAVELSRLVISSPAVVREMRQISRRGAHYSAYDRVLSLIIKQFSRRGGNEHSFFVSLKMEYDYYGAQPLQQVWIKALAYIIEQTFVCLTRSKYATGAVFFNEHKVNIGLSGMVISSGKKPIDVIAWSSQDDGGEFIEVKKNIDANEGGQSFEEKVIVMYKVARDMQVVYGSKSYVAIGTLSESPYAESIVNAILLSSGLQPLIPTCNLRIIKSQSIANWYRSKVI